MDLLYSIFFGAGVAGFTYTRMGRRVGFANSQYITIIVAVVFILATIFFLTLLKFILNV